MLQTIDDIKFLLVIEYTVGLEIEVFKINTVMYSVEIELENRIDYLEIENVSENKQVKSH